MFYLTHKTISEIQESDKVMVLADFSGIPAGTKGVIVENYKEGVMVRVLWYNSTGSFWSMRRPGCRAWLSRLV